MHVLAGTVKNIKEIETMAQNLQICQVCDTDERPKWKCFTCDVLLCDDCNIKIHVNIRKNSNHKVIDLKNVNSASVKTAMKFMNIKDIPCVSHETKSSIIYCQQCDQLICAVCLVEGHQSHKLIPEEEAYTDKLEKLCTTETNVNQSLQNVQSLTERIEQLKSDELKEYNEAKENIQRKEKELKEIVTKETERLIGELDKLWSPRVKVLTKTYTDLEALKQTLEQRKSKIDEIFQNHNAAQVFAFSGHQNEVTSTKNDLKKQSIKFSESGQDFEDVIKFGSIIKVPEFTIEETFHLDFYDIHRIKTLKNNLNIVCQLNEPKFHSFALQGGKCINGTAVGKVDGLITDMAVMDNTILFIVEGSPDVKSVVNFPVNTKVETYLSLPALYMPRAINATSSRVFIGFSDNEETNDSRRGVFIYNHVHEPSLIGTIELDSKNQRLIAGSGAITTNINGDICVVDRTSDLPWKGRLLVLGERGSLKLIYKGHPSINVESDFFPMDVLTTPLGLILVSDYWSHAVHVLSVEGCLLTSLNQSHGIERPRILNIDNDGKIQIGCDGEYVEDEFIETKLHVFNLNT